MDEADWLYFGEGGSAGVRCAALTLYGSSSIAALDAVVPHAIRVISQHVSPPSPALLGGKQAVLIIDDTCLTEFGSHSYGLDGIRSFLLLLGQNSAVDHACPL